MTDERSLTGEVGEVEVQGEGDLQVTAPGEVQGEGGGDHVTAAGEEGGGDHVTAAGEDVLDEEENEEELVPYSDIQGENVTKEEILPFDEQVKTVHNFCEVSDLK